MTLRPVEERDLEMIRAWRNADRVRTMMYSDQVISPDDQKRWFASLSGDERRAYYVFEWQSAPAGIVYFNPIDRERREANWGFYLGSDAPGAGVGRQMGREALELAFGPMRLDRVIGETFDFNEKSVRFHEKLGFERALEAEGATASGRRGTVIRFRLTKERWQKWKTKEGNA